MKNKGLLTRQGLGALGGHKTVVQNLPSQLAAPETEARDPQQQNDKQTIAVPGAASVLPKERMRAGEDMVQPSKRPRCRSHSATAMPAFKRYTLILKIPPDLRDTLITVLGTGSPGSKRAMMTVFRESLRYDEGPAEPESPSGPLVSWRIDLRLEQTLVADICAGGGSPLEPVSTTLARHVAARLARFVREISAPNANPSAP
jgi:hypothetical protein